MDRIGIFIARLLISIVLVLLSACDNKAWNDPHPAGEHDANNFYSSFSEQPKTLDPARAYNANEVVFDAQIYEPVIQYHYLKRPYTLIPLTAAQMPQVTYLDKNGQQLPDTAAAKDIFYSVYEIHIKPGIYYQPHPAFAKKTGKQGEGYAYHQLTEAELEEIDDLADFKQMGTRELTAADYVYEIKRLAHPEVQSPIFGVMSEYIVGLTEYAKILEKKYNDLVAKPHTSDFIDLTEIPLAGALVVDRYTFQIKIKGKYPQFLYWLAMPFFAPVPWEADSFYSQHGLELNNITLDWYPVGTGPYRLSINNPNREMVLVRNPNFHGENYPAEGESGDAKQGLLADANKPLPFIDKYIFSLEKESIPRWNKFLQGYYDQSGISSDSKCLKFL